MVVCGCLLAPVAYEHQKARNQHAAVAALEKLGGYLGFDSTTRPRSAWMGLLLGDDKFDHLAAVDFASGARITDAELIFLRSFAYLRVVELDGMPVTDASLTELGGKSLLVELSLKHTNVTGAGLAHLTGLSKLELLWLEGSPVTDAGVQNLQRALPNVRIHR
jgi:hypothetical protein